MNNCLWSIDRMVLTRENWSTQERKTAPLSTTNPTWTDLGSNLGLCFQRLMTDLMTHGMV